MQTEQLQEESTAPEVWGVGLGELLQTGSPQVGGAPPLEGLPHRQGQPQRAALPEHPEGRGLLGQHAGPR